MPIQQEQFPPKMEERELKDKNDVNKPRTEVKWSLKEVDTVKEDEFV